MLDVGGRRRGRVRLECTGCDAQYDGISQVQVGVLIAGGWKDIEQRRSYLEATTTGNVMDWQTHMGYCPDCADKR